MQSLPTLHRKLVKTRCSVEYADDCKPGEVSPCREGNYFIEYEHLRLYTNHRMYAFVEDYTKLVGSASRGGRVRGAHGIYSQCRCIVV